MGAFRISKGLLQSLASPRRGHLRWIGVSLLVLALAACGGSGSPSSTSAAGGPGAVPAAAPIRIGMIYPKSGPLALYGRQYRHGFEAGLAEVTDGSGKIDGHPVEVTWKDSAGHPGQAVSAAKTLIGQGYTILAGTADSAVALRVAAVAAHNQVLFISGPAATDKLSGINEYTFRSGRQTWQDVKAAAALLGSPAGKRVLVLAQNYAFGQANAAAVKDVLGGAGAKVSDLLVPLATTDFTPFAQKIRTAHPDLLFIAWAGASTNAMWHTLDQQGIFNATTVVTGLGGSATFNAYGPATTRLKFLAYYFPDAPDNAVNRAMIRRITEAGGTPDLFSPDGFVAAQMIAHAVGKAQGAGDVKAMIDALEGWSFDAPKGRQTVRAGDHVMLQPMYVARLMRSDTGYAPERVRTVSAAATAPPLAGQ